MIKIIIARLTDTLKTKYNVLSKTLYVVPILLIMSLTMAGGKGKFDGDTILHHVVNDKHSVLYEIHDPFFGTDISISKHVVMLWIVAFLTIALSLYATRIYRKDILARPKGLSHIFEILMEFIKSDIVIPNIGKERHKMWTPLIFTFFIFILLGNFIGMVPFFEKLHLITPGVAGSATITGNIGVTLALATITFFSIIIAGTLKHGFIGHWKNLIPGGVPAPVLLILIPIEIMGMIIKPAALTLRLGANMTAGHIALVAIFGIPMILYDAGAGYSLGVSYAVVVVSVLLNTAIYFLEIIVCLVQAYVFSLLSAVFIGMAIHAHH